MSISTHLIKAKSHILSLLGNELIGSDSLAIFELVKNAYDADAENIKINFIDLIVSLPNLLLSLSPGLFAPLNFFRVLLVPSILEL